MQLRETQRHLYEIHTAPQSDLVGTILSTEHIVELARLKDFLGNSRPIGQGLRPTSLTICGVTDHIRVAHRLKAGRVPAFADIVTDLRDLVVYALEEFAPAAVSNEMTTTRTELSGTAMSETKEFKPTSEVREVAANPRIKNCQRKL